MAEAIAAGDLSGTIQVSGNDEIAHALDVCFYATLVESVVLVVLLNLVQAQEELAVNRAGATHWPISAIGCIPADKRGY